MQYVINEKPISEEHVAWFTSGDSRTIRLHEVVKAFYRHPDAPEHALVPVLEERFHGEKLRVAHEAAAWVLLEATQQAVCIVKISGDQQIANASAAMAEKK